MAHRIALASTNGEFIDVHFAQATQFVIAEIDEGNTRVIETRKREGPCVGCGHDGCAIEQIIELLRDCESIFAAKVGLGAAGAVLASGKRIFEAPGPVEAVLEKLVQKQILDHGRQIENVEGEPANEPSA